ncbi:MAG: ABC transporter ATP-binding protein [Chloroflexi bacterium]|jgi:oligopeptide transport system ATP-binding protein|nr:ABC transporter ATP-binding protein [Chloroflexota bacterium]
MTLLQVQDLEVRFYTKDGEVQAVNGISYSLDEGETLGIVGESGCGKSVSTMAMVRLLPEPPAKITGGHVIFEGKDILYLKPSERHQVRGGKIALIFQDPMTSLNPVMTIGDQIGEAVQVNLGLNKEQARQRVIEVLTQVGIPKAEERLGDYPHQFSGGMRQRVMIAMAISCRPKLLIADEPTTSLDVTIQAQIVELVRRLQRELNMAVIWITHDLGVVARIAQRINVMYAGYIIETGPIKRIFKRPSHPYTVGLLGSVPRMDLGTDRELYYVEGAPPDMIRLPEGCPFHPRCQYRTERCLQERPVLAEVEPEHQSACWNVEALLAGRADQPTGKGRA